jgi:phosphohistidine phosphatase
LDDAVETKHLVAHTEEPVMIVGHLPHLSRLASLLVLGDAEKEVVRFRMGAVVCLARSGESWSIDWTLIPAFAQQTGEPGGREKRE